MCLTVGVTVVGMSDTAEPLLSSCVPDLQRMIEEGYRRIENEVPIFLISPPFAHPSH